MRTTISIDDDVLERARAIATKLHSPFKTVVNEALRAGLDHVEKPAKRRSYKTEPHTMGLRSGRNIDNIQELLAQIEGEDTR
jgi:predicted transcriptional regulator